MPHELADDRIAGDTKSFEHLPNPAAMRKIT